MKVLVLGGYGLIGSAVVDRLLADGHDVSALGRTVGEAAGKRPAVRWFAADMARLSRRDDWLPLLIDVEAVVNAAGALQDGPRDCLEAVHRDSVVALVAACEQLGVRRFVQISAVGVLSASNAAFFRTKAEGDAAVSSSSLAWTILRPGLVIAQNAYGGTALLRALSAFPVFIPAVMAEAPLQTVAAKDVARAVSLALAGSLPPHLTADLVEEKSRSLADILQAFRNWLGLPKAKVVPMPVFVGRLMSLAADALGFMGWRSPLRSTAFSSLAGGVIGDPGPWRTASGLSPQPLEITLAQMPATVQERWFARLWLLKPVILGCLSLFWIFSGIVGLWKSDEAGQILVSHGVADGFANVTVLAGGIADIMAGAAVLVRSTARMGLLAMAAIMCVYLAGSAVLTPDLWLDPLGPLVKTLPALCLVFVALAILDER